MLRSSRSRGWPPWVGHRWDDLDPTFHLTAVVCRERKIVSKKHRTSNHLLEHQGMMCLIQISAGKPTIPGDDEVWPSEKNKWFHWRSFSRYHLKVESNFCQLRKKTGPEARSIIYTGCVKQGSLFHGLWNNPHITGFFWCFIYPKKSSSALRENNCLLSVCTASQ